MAIRILPPQLANQIAAGEVVERPASVVKELVENSLDAGATRIDIDIERGGEKLIRIRDNGCGIAKDELALALARHATSKIATLDDLEAIMSMGFRGEALASISSVSRLTFTSRTCDQNEAWQAYAEGREMEVTLKPAAHPAGSTVEVLDLFFNTPARRKFLRTEKTEFGHIDEVVRRIALSRFDVAINLTHNGKLMRQYRPVKAEDQQERRLGAICGTAFMQQALAVTWSHEALEIRGWVASPADYNGPADLQYCYVNGRMMRDRLINHAIRQAYEDRLSGDQQPAYVLYLTIDPRQVDVNVHPAKHEVRFHQARLVHDFIYQAVLSVLKQHEQPDSLFEPEPSAPQTQHVPENRAAAGKNIFDREEVLTPPPHRETTGGGASHSGRSSGKPAYSADKPAYSPKEAGIYQSLMQTPAETRPQLFPEKSTFLSENRISAASEPVTEKSERVSFGKILTLYPPCYALIETDSGIALFSLSKASHYLRCQQLIPGEQGLKSQPLMIPLQMALSAQECETFTQFAGVLRTFGIEGSVSRGKATIRTVSLPLRQQNLPHLIPELLSFLAAHPEADEKAIASRLAELLVSEPAVQSKAQAVQLLADVERLCPQLVRRPPADLLQLIDLTEVVAALRHE
ncbi:TPA: DNA mismatch repair endonuclease MutL [Morganella morganii subsp. morganii]|uniref:DNA mismatch repair protein MutL n=1 Tax=Morganella morganii TaxID=582 RepID=A0AAU8ZL52_MORMO|nr:DNA mismatch repair endonuclease MutL [Morganella morganii]HDU8692390.1 DNA mismatch repair endonuclease MutL [Morganella morganii subsp. morganii]AWC93520.1 DNA mismatch repair endonuclease MutL [Morganella morganii]EKW8486760.1 DNA mismatch repair endonuclease MutL [Morganella morganii]HAT3623873.1 DNA mismatch repair endonuclease MutL [Morganella morganii]HCU0878556.1 DNA mismatch repair endonuclease MutL [Morganella morganii]